MLLAVASIVRSSMAIVRYRFIIHQCFLIPGCMLECVSFVTIYNWITQYIYKIRAFNVLIFRFLDLYRFVAALWPMMYKVWVTRGLLKEIIFGSLVISFAFGGLGEFISPFVIQYILLRVSGFYFLLMIITYSLDKWKIRNSQQQFNIGNERRLKTRPYIVSGLIVLSYLLFCNTVYNHDIS